MSQSGIFETRESGFAWLPAIAIAATFHASIFALGYWQPQDDLLDLIAQGEQAANDPPAPAAEEFFEVEWAPQPVVEPPVEQAAEPSPEPEPEPIPEPVQEPIPEPVVAPEFIQPVAEKPTEPPKEIPKQPEPPKPVVTVKPTAPEKPKPTVARKETSPPRPSTPRATNAPAGTGPGISTGTNPNGKGDPNFAPSDLVVGNKNFPKPPYPTEARRKRLQGTVLLKISVSSGRVSNVVVIKSSGHPILDSTASRFVKGNWKFPSGLTRNLNQKILFGISS